jgi:hypothetical protein
MIRTISAPKRPAPRRKDFIMGSFPSMQCRQAHHVFFGGVSGFEFGGDPALAHNVDTVAKVSAVIKWLKSRSEPEDALGGSALRARQQRKLPMVRIVRDRVT